jgi:hypothetical protein
MNPSAPMSMQNGARGDVLEQQSPTVQQYIHRMRVFHQTMLDKSSPQTLYRWLAWSACLIMYLVRVFFIIEGFYIVTYAMAIFNLNLLLGFLTPLELPMSADDGPGLPSKSNDEFRPFVRRLPEFKFWYASIRSLLLGFFATFFPIFDVPVFWPILVMYWLILFFVTMKRQIKHMIKYKYVPFSFGKKKYGGGSSVKLAK